ncbi:MAG: FMN-binding protein [Acidobacteriota bacterium]|jgi:Na+-translocating ferredoxin:NAD+ oxidoreductase RnfG subunit
MSSSRTFLLAVAGIAVAASSLAAQLLSLEEALALAFPRAQVQRRPLFLTDEQRHQVRRLAGTPPASGMVMRYEAVREGQLVGVAYTDTHRVRTLGATLLVALTPEGAVTRVELLSFAEPKEYVPRPEWYGQLHGRRLDGELALKRGVRPVAGATLTATATVEAVRRVLAIHTVVGPPRHE